jgi:thymidylate kinase
MRIVVDGNDGTGKSTLVRRLAALGYDVADRGIPTKMTDDDAIRPREDEFYLILDAPVIICRERLRKAGKDLAERYHRIEDLMHYRRRFRAVAARLPRSALIDAIGNEADVLARCMAALASAGIAQPSLR